MVSGTYFQMVEQKSISILMLKKKKDQPRGGKEECSHNIVNQLYFYKIKKRKSPEEKTKGDNMLIF